MATDQPITVLYFAAARERAGVSREILTLDAWPAQLDRLLDTVVSRHPGLASLRPHLRIAVNREFVPLDSEVPPGAEVALIPPVAGGSGACRLSAEPLDVDSVARAVRGEPRGGEVIFIGTVRSPSNGKRVLKLEYEAYAPMAVQVFEAIAAEAARTWPGCQVAIAHRVGALVPGEISVVVAAAAPHRAEAFEACRFAIDRLKRDAPIWKKEQFEDGARWVGCN